MSEGPVNMLVMFIAAFAVISLVYYMYQPYMTAESRELSQKFSQYSSEYAALSSLPSVKGTPSELVLSGDSCSVGRGLSACMMQLSKELEQDSKKLAPSLSSEKLLAESKVVEECKPYADAMIESCLKSIDYEKCAQDRQEYYTFCGVV